MIQQMISNPTRSNPSNHPLPCSALFLAIALSLTGCSTTPEVDDSNAMQTGVIKNPVFGHLTLSDTGYTFDRFVLSEKGVLSDEAWVRLDTMSPMWNTSGTESCMIVPERNRDKVDTPCTEQPELFLSAKTDLGPAATVTNLLGATFTAGISLLLARPGYVEFEKKEYQEAVSEALNSTPNLTEKLRQIGNELEKDDEYTEYLTQEKPRIRYTVINQLPDMAFDPLRYMSREFVSKFPKVTIETLPKSEASSKSAGGSLNAMLNGVKEYRTLDEALTEIRAKQTGEWFYRVNCSWVSRDVLAAYECPERISANAEELPIQFTVSGLRIRNAEVAGIKEQRKRNLSIEFKPVSSEQWKITNLSSSPIMLKRMEFEYDRRDVEMPLETFGKIEPGESVSFSFPNVIYTELQPDIVVDSGITERSIRWSLDIQYHPVYGSDWLQTVNFSGIHPETKSANASAIRAALPDLLEKRKPKSIEETLNEHLQE